MGRLRGFRWAPGAPAPLIPAATELGSFERWLSLWVGLAIAAGMVLGQWFPGLFTLLGGLAVAQINLVIAALIWLMIYPMMLAGGHRQPQRLALP